MLRDPATTADQCQAAMASVYRALPEEQSGSFAELFRRIASGDIPLMFHCTAGKDRTGVATALLLAVLGVPRDVIDADYLLTRQTIDRSMADTRAALKHGGSPPVSEAVLRPIMNAEPHYLDAMFEEVELRFESVEGYTTQRLGISADELALLREHMLD